MKLFSTLYEKMMRWADHPRATWYLGSMSFAESSFFPVPPDVMLIPMILAKPHQSWRYAGIASIFSVIGGVFGYLLGYLFIAALHPYLEHFGYATAYQKVLLWFQHWGVLLVLLAGFSPIPYKLFTLAAGALGLALLPFILASCLGRGARFFLVAALTRWAGPRMMPHLHRYIDILGWLFVCLVFLGSIVYYLSGHSA